MAISPKRLFIKRMTFEIKNTVKHKHNFSIPCILEITNKNIHASANYYNKKEYYNVLKCDMCDSFIPKSQKGNFSGSIFNGDYDKELPLITANTNMKCPAYNFYDLFDVVINYKD